MALIQRSDLVERIRRAFGLREAGVGSTVSPELVPVILVDDLTGPSIDEGYPRNVVGKVQAGQSVGVYAEVFLIPQGTADLVVTELWIRRGNTTGGVYISRGLTANLNNLLGTQPPLRNMDLRVETVANTRTDSRNQAGLSTMTTILELGSVPTTYVSFPGGFTVPPGSFLNVVPTGNNEGIEVIVWGYERLRTTT